MLTCLVFCGQMTVILAHAKTEALVQKPLMTKATLAPVSLVLLDNTVKLVSINNETFF